MDKLSLKMIFSRFSRIILIDPMRRDLIERKRKYFSKT